MLLSSTQLLFVFASSVLCVIGVWVASQKVTTKSVERKPIEPTGTETRFLFRAGALIDANPAALEICAETPADVFDWSTMHQKMQSLFPDFPATQGSVRHRDVKVLHSQDPTDKSILTIDQWNDVARVVIEQDKTHDATRRTAIMHSMFKAPNPVWKADDTGQVIWCNATYKELSESLGYARRCALLFDVSSLTPGGPSERICVTNRDETRTRWFDVTAVQTGHHVMYYATKADAVVSALDAQRSFVQTFSKTFAHLSTGLAVFDQDRLLILFNPALLELTGLTADRLSKRCDIKSFFDQLRELQIVPDTSTKRSWAKQVHTITQAALNGRYSETWTLPTGVTYRVTGRRHPDGALAFMFEDITAEITITRRFRAELEQCHHVIDAVSNALVLFCSNGQVHLSNDAYRKLWKADPDSSFAKYTLRDAISLWENGCLPSDIWPEVQRRILSTTERESWHTTVVLKTRDSLRISLKPIAGGMMLVSFDQLTPVTPAETIKSDAGHGL